MKRVVKRSAIGVAVAGIVFAAANLVASLLWQSAQRNSKTAIPLMERADQA